jgi:hypothetical protein
LKIAFEKKYISNNMATTPSMFGVIEKLNQEFEDLYKEKEALKKEKEKLKTMAKERQVRTQVYRNLLPRICDETAIDMNKFISQGHYSHDEALNDRDNFLDLVRVCKEYMDEIKAGNNTKKHCDLYSKAIYIELFKMGQNPDINCQYVGRTGCSSWQVVSEDWIRDRYIEQWEENIQYEVEDEEIPPPSKEDCWIDIMDFLDQNTDWYIYESWDGNYLFWDGN